MLVKTLEGNGEHNRVLYVLKARGMANSNQIREFLLTDHGIELSDVNLERRRQSLDAQTATLWREFDDESDIVKRLLSHGSIGADDRADQRVAQDLLRGADVATKVGIDDVHVDEHGAL